MSDLAEAGPGAVAMHAVNNARQLLLLPEPEFARVAELLAPVPDLILRQQTYIERLEGANAALCEQFAAEQRERELLVEAFSLTMADAAEFHRRADALRGRGTPRAIPRIATDNTPRFVAAGRD
jgi:hypothetical protein